MEVAGAGFLDGIDHVSHAPAILRRVGVGLNLELLQFIDRGHVDDAVPIARAIPMAIEEEDRRAHAASSEIEEGDVLVYVALGSRRIQRLILLAIIHAGIQIHQAEYIADVQRKLDGLLPANLRADIGAAGYQNRRAGLHFDGLGYCAERQLGVESGRWPTSSTTLATRAMEKPGFSTVSS